MAFSLEREQTAFGWNQLTPGSSRNEEILKKMQSSDPETIDALLSMISVWQEEEKETKPGGNAGSGLGG